MLNASWRLPWGHWLALLVVCICLATSNFRDHSHKNTCPISLHQHENRFEQTAPEVDYNLFQALILPPGFLTGIKGECVLKLYLSPLPVPTQITAIHVPQTGRQKPPHISSCSNIYTSGWHNAKYCPSLQQILKAMVWPKLFSGSFPLLPVLYLPIVTSTTKISGWRMPFFLGLLFPPPSFFMQLHKQHGEGGGRDFFHNTLSGCVISDQAKAE